MTTLTQVYNKDASVESDFPTENFDYEIMIEINDSLGKGAAVYANAYFEVDLSTSGIDYSWVTAAYAKMKLSAGVIPDAFRIRIDRTTTFGETTITWNTKPGSTTPYSNEVKPGSGWNTWTLTSQVVDALQNRSGLWIVRAQYTAYGIGEWNYAVFYTRHDDADIRPYLQVEYTVPSGGAKTQIILF